MSKQTNAKAPISSVTEEKSSAHKVMRHILIRKFCGKKYHIFTFVSSSSSSVSSLSSRWSRLGRELRTLKKAVDLWLRFGDQDIIAAPPYFMIIIILLLLIVIIITNHHHCHMMIRRFWASQWRRSTSLVCSNVRRNTPRLQRVFSTSPRLTYNVIILMINDYGEERSSTPEYEEFKWCLKQNKI